MIDQQTLRTLIQRYWETFRPEEYRTVVDPEAFLKEQTSQLTTGLKTYLAATQPSPTSSDYLTNLGNLRMAASSAIEAALLDLLPPPESATPSQLEAPDPRTQLVTEFMAELP